MAKSKKYPLQVFVVREQEANSSVSYLSAVENFGYLAVVDDAREVAVYKLERITKIKAKAVLE